MNSFVTIFEFDINSGVTENDLRSSEAALDQFLKEQPGFMYRSLLKKTSGQWIDLYYWKDQSTAELGSKAFMESEAGKAFLTLIDLPSTSVTKDNVFSETIGPECA